MGISSRLLKPILKIRPGLFLLLLFLGGAGLFPQTLREKKEDLNLRLSARAALLMDYDTGRVLYEKNGNAPLPPASMTKVMTLFLVYDKLAEGLIQREEKIKIDAIGSSFSRPPGSSLMNLEEGQEVSILELMRGLAIASGNDAAYALANYLGPGVTAFVTQMNEKATFLGLQTTYFVDPDGLSASNKVTPWEFAVLARAYIQNYPEALGELHSIPTMAYPLTHNLVDPNKNYRISTARVKRNTNRLLGNYEGIDGLKTGYTGASGFNFTATASRGSIRLISVVMGIYSPGNYGLGLTSRADQARILLDFGFDNYQEEALPPPMIPEIRVFYGREKTLRPVATAPPQILINQGEVQEIYTLIQLRNTPQAPLDEGELLGEVEYFLGNISLGSSPLVAPRTIRRGGPLRFFEDLFLSLQWSKKERRVIF